MTRGAVADEHAVSDVMGTALMLGITITIFAVVGFIVLDHFSDADDATRVNVRSYQKDDYLLQHKGGDALVLEKGHVIVDVDGEGHTTIPLKDFKTETVDETAWRLGESLCLSCHTSLQGKTINGVMLVYRNEVLLRDDGFLATNTGGGGGNLGGPPDCLTHPNNVNCKTNWYDHNGTGPWEDVDGDLEYNSTKGDIPRPCSDFADGIFKAEAGYGLVIPKEAVECVQITAQKVDFSADQGMRLEVNLSSDTGSPFNHIQITAGYSASRDASLIITNPDYPLLWEATNKIELVVDGNMILTNTTFNALAGDPDEQKDGIQIKVSGATHPVNIYANGTKWMAQKSIEIPLTADPITKDFYFVGAQFESEKASVTLNTQGGSLHIANASFITGTLSDSKQDVTLIAAHDLDGTGAQITADDEIVINSGDRLTLEDAIIDSASGSYVRLDAGGQMDANRAYIQAEGVIELENLGGPMNLDSAIIDSTSGGITMAGSGDWNAANAVMRAEDDIIIGNFAGALNSDRIDIRSTDGKVTMTSSGTAAVTKARIVAVDLFRIATGGSINASETDLDVTAGPLTIDGRSGSVQIMDANFTAASTIHVYAKKPPSGGGTTLVATASEFSASTEVKFFSNGADFFAQVTASRLTGLANELLVGVVNGNNSNQYCDPRTSDDLAQGECWNNVGF